ncbi:hypothetical protein [Soonwooa sp.]|nr:hypothetical protein [Soonwooa sp.]
MKSIKNKESMFSLCLITRCILTCFLLVLFSTPSSAQIYLTGDVKITTTDGAVVSINVNPETANTFVTRKEAQEKKLPRKHKNPIEAISKSKSQKGLKKISGFKN